MVDVGALAGVLMRQTLMSSVSRMLAPRDCIQISISEDSVYILLYYHPFRVTYEKNKIHI